MGTQGPGRKRIPNREKLTAEDDALSQIAREAEARLAAKRAARAEAREIRMKELERQQKEEDSERYSRHSRRHTSVSDDEERMSVGSRGSLRPSDYSGFLGSSSRASSRASSARASPVGLHGNTAAINQSINQQSVCLCVQVEERPDRDFLDKGSRTASTLSAATLASLGGASSRRGSCDTSFSVETEASIREIKDSLAEAEERYRKAMVSNAQLHNEKSTLMYQVETLREELSDMEEVLWEARRHCDDTTKELERERQAHSVLQFQFKEMKETLKQTEELLTEVSELRVQSSSFSQEVCDLQEALQWKEKKIWALERQREISDIVRIERDRLREEVIRLQDSLKKHGIVISPEITTNGETGEGKAQDDVSAESDSRLAQEPCHSGRESMLGKVQEWQPAEGSKLPQDGVRLYKRFQSLNVTSEQTKAFTVKPATAMDSHPGRNKSKPPRNHGSEKKCASRQDGDLLFRNEGVKKQLVKVKEVRKVETKQTQPGSVVAQLMVEGQALKGRTRPDRADVSAASHQEVSGMGNRGFDDKTCKIQTNPRGQPFTCQLEDQAKCEEVVSPVHRTSTGKVLKSRLIPPRPIKDIIFDSKAIVSSILNAGKQNSSTQEKQKSFQNQGKDGKTSKDGQCPHRKTVPDIIKESKIKEISAPTSVNSLKDNESVEELSETGGEASDGQSLEDEDTKLFTDLSEHETDVFKGETSQSLEHQQLTISENVRSTLNEGSAFEREGDFSCSETKLKTSEFLPAEEAVAGGRLRTLEEVKKRRVYKEEDPVREAVQLQETSRDISSEGLKFKDQTKTLKSSAVSPSVPSELVEDWSGLETMIQTILRGFAENQSFVAEISRIVPEIPGSLNCWILELEKTLKRVTGNVLNQHVGAEQASKSQMKVTSKSELPFKDSPEGARTPEDPEDLGTRTTGPSATLKDSSVPGMLEVAFQDGRTHHDDVDESSPEEKSGTNSEGSEHDSKMTSCYEDFVFVESYFAEPVETRAMESSSDQGLVEASTKLKKLEGKNVVDDHRAEVVDKKNEQRETVCSQSCLVTVEDPKVTQLKRHRTISTNCHIDQSSKIRRLIEITADEIKAMAAPELTLRNLPEGRVLEHPHIEASPGSNIDDGAEETWVEDMDSCEEADENAAAPERHPVMEVVVSGVSSVQRLKGFGLDNRKEEQNTDCKIS
ncbi:myosin heavy chain, non-muscle isoform X6 [Trachinotus anak]|uniref:myosin heavy chain, non-muscle isoform X6 n=1 Tax=Trachinotus anak TaxID=443729 RepID=UPI0039F2409A